MKKTFRNRLAAGIAIAAIAIGAAACSNPSSGAQQSAVNNDTHSSAVALQQLQTVQPTPFFSWSQIRETLIEVETAEAHSVQTTSFGFNQGVQDPVFTCPSIGLPVAADTQLTNPDQIVHDGWVNGGADPVISQVDPTGVYTGQSTGTYVVCVAPDGSTYIQYAEEFVDTVTGPAVWNETTHSVQLTGPSTATVKTHQ